MRKILIIPFTILSAALCVALNYMLTPSVDLTTDKAFETNSVISPMETLGGISADDIYTEDPFQVAAIDNGDTGPAGSIRGLGQNNRLASAASYAAFMDSKIDLSKVSVKLQTSILTDMINSYNYGKNKITLVSGTDGGLKGDTSALEALVGKSGKTVSFMAIRLKDGASVGYNVDDFFQSCSTIKIPMTLYAAKLIQQGKLSYNDIFTYTSDAYLGGSGVIKNYDIGTRFKLKTLVTYAITESDNIAHQIICQNLGSNNLYEYLDEIGCDIKAENYESRTYWPDSNARSSALWWSQVYLFKDSGDVGHWYWNLLQNAPSRIDTALSHAKACYTKSGSSSYCLHEAGIIMGEQPYLVVIFTRSSSASNNTESYFYQVARAIDALICS